MAAGLAQHRVCGDSEGTGWVGGILYSATSTMPTCSVAAVGATLAIDVPASRLGPVLAWLSHRELAAWITPRRRVMLHNEVASAVVQVGTWDESAAFE